VVSKLCQNVGLQTGIWHRAVTSQTVCVQ